MKVTITLGDGSVFEGESFCLEFALDEAAQKCGMLEEGEVVRILSTEQQQLID